MTPDDGHANKEAPPVHERINLLFEVWRRPDGTERSNEEIAHAVSTRGFVLAADALEAARSGRSDLDDGVLGAIADEFPVDRSYLTSDEVESLHKQLVLLREVGASGIKGIHLRGGQDGIDAAGLAELLRELRVREPNGPQG